MFYAAPGFLEKVLGATIIVTIVALGGKEDKACIATVNTQFEAWHKKYNKLINKDKKQLAFAPSSLF